jgi:hypothetical protein
MAKVGDCLAALQPVYPADKRELITATLNSRTALL